MKKKTQEEEAGRRRSRKKKKQEGDPKEEEAEAQTQGRERGFIFLKKISEEHYDLFTAIARCT